MPIMNFRVSDPEKAELEARGRGNTSKYIRDRLFGAIEDHDLLHRMLDRLEHGGEGQPFAAALELSMLTELLLLMRLSVKPDAMKQAQAEVERLGLQVWSSQAGSRRT